MGQLCALSPWLEINLALMLQSTSLTRPNRPFHNFRAQNTSIDILSMVRNWIDGFWCSKIVKCSIGEWWRQFLIWDMTATFSALSLVAFKLSAIRVGGACSSFCCQEFKRKKGGKIEQPAAHTYGTHEKKLTYTHSKLSLSAYLKKWEEEEETLNSFRNSILLPLSPLFFVPLRRGKYSDTNIRTYKRVVSQPCTQTRCIWGRGGGLTGWPWKSISTRENIYMAKEEVGRRSRRRSYLTPCLSP